MKYINKLDINFNKWEKLNNNIIDILNSKKSIIKVNNIKDIKTIEKIVNFNLDFLYERKCVYIFSSKKKFIGYIDCDSYKYLLNHHITEYYYDMNKDIFIQIKNLKK
jgi:hypothetical protein